MSFAVIRAFNIRSIVRLPLPDPFWVLCAVANRYQYEMHTNRRSSCGSQKDTVIASLLLILVLFGTIVGLGTAISGPATPRHHIWHRRHDFRLLSLRFAVHSSPSR